MFAGRLIGGVLPYLTCIVFLLGIGYRIHKWNRASVSKMALFPVPSGPVGRWNRMAGEVLIFKGLLAGDKPLWIGTWVFHATLFLILAGHSRIVTDFPLLWSSLGMGRGEADSLAGITGGCAGLILLGTGLYLLLRRLAVLRVREISGLEDYLSLGLILAVVVTGDMMRFSPRFDLEAVRGYFAGLIVLRADAVPSDPWFLLHFLLGQLLIMYLPFSKFLHIPGIFYSNFLLNRA